ncbi:hypothetical protein M8J76_000181 [Diaphorina citri]|nr:hypothetical protein M8J75_012647 [Diaphorina citri]KAI5723038.1 hypothetical protein M8J76_000181 [Diaphorina citri]
MIATGGTKWAVPQPPPPLSGPRTPVESFLRAFKRRSLRVKRSKSLVITEKRKSERDSTFPIGLQKESQPKKSMWSICVTTATPRATEATVET